MTFRDWQQLSPDAAARELHLRLATRLPPAQQRAAVARVTAEAELAGGFAAASGPLARVPYFAKDLFDVAGLPTLAGSTFLPEVRPTPSHDGALITAMRKAGAVLAGKAHMHEFAYGITGENPHYGDVEVPGHPGRTTGGSSSGSVALVAAGVVPLALGSDTGGSVRLPAAFCGLHGFRLTPGHAWIRDAMPLAPSYDTAGWFTANASDLLASISALVGLTSPAREPRGCYLEMPGLDRDVSEACARAAQNYTAPASASVRKELLNGFGPAVDTYNTVVAQEAWSVHQAWAERYRDRYSTGVWQRLNRVHSLSPAQIETARAETQKLRALWQAYFSQHDFIILAASPTPALTKAECTLENRTRILTLTAPASIGGLPVVSVPVPLESGLTTGLQIIVPSVTSPAISWALDRAAGAST